MFLSQHHKTNNLQILRSINYIESNLLRSTGKAFLFAYVYVTLPNILKKLSTYNKQSKHDIITSIIKTLEKALHPSKFPMFAARIVAGINILEPIFYKVLRSSKTVKSKRINEFISVFLASLAAALTTFPDFQGHVISRNRFYSLDLTLLLVTRALDTIISSSLQPFIPSSLSSYGDALLFVLSSSTIMISWFYYPERLPPAYRNWITSAADMDNELVEALRYMHFGEYVYGETGKHDKILIPLCERYNIDPIQGDPSVTFPIPCQLVHANVSSNCELHALWRFSRGFKFALKIYGPINLLMLLFRKGNFRKRLLAAVTSSIRSSSFLGFFIALNWYGVCLARSRLGPKLFPNAKPLWFDKSKGPILGSIISSISCLVELPQRRKELALFVAPRALGAILPSEPEKLYLQIESLAFSLSFAVLVAFSRSNPEKIRGIFGKGLKQVFNIEN